MTGSAALAQLRAALPAALPGIEQPRLALYRVVRDVGGKLSLQRYDAADKVGDMLPIEVWPGVPGATSDPTPGELVVVAFVGDVQRPCVLGRVYEGGPGWPPAKVQLDAAQEVRLLGDVLSAAAVAKVGADLPSPPVPVALAPELALYLQKLEAWALTLDLMLNIVLPLIPATPTVEYLGAVADRLAAAQYPGVPSAGAATFTFIESDNLEAK